MLLLPGETGLSPAMIGLRIICRDAAMRSGRPYALVGQEGTTPSILPWWAWVTIGGLAIGLARLVIVRRAGRDTPAYVLADRDAPAFEAATSTVDAPPPVLHPFSPDADLIAAFDRDAEESMASIWRDVGG